ncbi:CRISPR system precrRNA processing endoribonuclease RAMP protein Cas6 [Rhodobacteraceae bacterium 2376]|uniref:CRISPR system precrRNA processing endoribonuclease RAMP protein Cas6 n=1 Tax=Rhabdonatronobacter sediminivivens TaxID=2743469 RepID=A0A7Z0L1S0_9RHOB|nr:CRISPR system precrRNA processing endoribonuclease RAMP protein Cas6 [Rhabdonatronobacter sediminivivens]NYS26048.1 CRISPR system precrRNA processing endoribonuclease RAMP protein Cas6 [Rhabdonatronobacter sediminivivens]
MSAQGNAIEWARVQVSATSPEPLRDSVTLPDRIRGALGRALADHKTHRDAAALHRILFGAVAQDGSSLRPFTIQCDSRGGRTEVTLNLLGGAASLLDAAGAGLVAALQGGIRVAPNNKRRALLQCEDPVFERHVGFTPCGPGSATRLHIRLVTPLLLRHGRHGVAGSLDPLPHVIARRLHWLSRLWTDTGVDVTSPGPLSQGLRVHEARLHPVNYQRYSRTHPEGMQFVMLGGSIVFIGNPMPFMPLLAFAEVFHAGSMTAQGAGRLCCAVS